MVEYSANVCGGVIITQAVDEGRFVNQFYYYGRVQLAKKTIILVLDRLETHPAVSSFLSSQLIKYVQQKLLPFFQSRAS